MAMTYTDLDALTKEVSLEILEKLAPDGAGGIDTDVVDVSIHAPARGATRHDPQGRGLFARFQSTHPRGVRLFGCSVKYSAACKR